jgi:hypothetical protein
MSNDGAILNLEALNDQERDLIGQCLRAAASGPFFPDWEFHTLFGLDRDDVLAIAAEWPVVVDRDAVELAINNAVVHLLWYPHGCEVEWPEWISDTPERLYNILTKLRGTRTLNFFESIM